MKMKINLAPAWFEPSISWIGPQCCTNYTTWTIETVGFKHRWKKAKILVEGGITIIFNLFYCLTTILQIWNNFFFFFFMKHGGIRTGLDLLQTTQRLYLMPNSHPFSQLITEYSVIQYYSYRNICDRSQRKKSLINHKQFCD